MPAVGETAAALIGVDAYSMANGARCSESHTLSVESAEVEMICRPSNENPHHMTLLECAIRDPRHLPLSASHRLSSLLPIDAVTKLIPFGEKAHAQTWLQSPLQVRRQFPVRTFQNRRTPSPAANM